MKGDAFWNRHRRLSAMKTAEKDGRVADSLAIRKALMEKVKTGESTLEEVQAELSKIKRGAKKQGLITRDQAFRGKS